MIRLSKKKLSVS